MMDNEQWRFQWSVKSPAGGMLNIRAERADELELALESALAMVPQMLIVEQAMSAAGTVAQQMPLAPQQPQQPPPGWSQQPQQAPQAPPQQHQQPQYPQQGPPPQAPPQQQQQQAPLCPGHGVPAKWVKPGVSQSSGRPYPGFWACAMPREQQCKFPRD